MRPVEYAIDELWSLLGQAGSEKGPEDATVRYLCALFAELAYHHIPDWDPPRDWPWHETCAGRNGRA